MTDKNDTLQVLIDDCEPRDDAILSAYKETRDTIVKELPLRIIVTAVVAVIVGLLINPFISFGWWAVSSIALGVEAALFMRFFKTRPTHISVKVKTLFASVSFVTASIYTIVAWLLFFHHTPSAIFAATALMAGTLVHLTVHNANTRLIYASAVAPMAATMLTAGVVLSLETQMLAPSLTAVAFIALIIAAYKARTDYTKKLRRAMDTANEGKAAAEEAFIAKTRFLAKMSHELRTPLNGIIGMADVLRESELTEQQREQLDIILGSGDTLLWLLNEILDHAKIEANHFTLENADEDLRDIVAQSTMLYRPGAIRKGIALTYDAEGIDTPFVHVDGRRLRQCLTNLISNAVKFTESGAVLVKARAFEISTEPKVGQAGDDASGVAANALSQEQNEQNDEPRRAIIEITVSDTGIGMSQAETARIFDAFEQADNSITRRFGGTGLGLAVSQAVARAMGGEITVTSEPGVGSTFVIRMEAVLGAPPEQDELEMFEPLMPVGGGKVLVVEDNIVNRKVVGALLKDRRVEFVEAENGEIALTKIAEEPFDLVLMDIHMPVMDGLTATKNIRGSTEEWSSIPIVALTAAVAPEDKAACISAGMEEVLAKPVRASDIADVMERYVWNKKKGGAARFGGDAKGATGAGSKSDGAGVLSRDGSKARLKSA
ncbi:MAG: response regulator [Pseudomonadota bacterium]